MRLLAVVAVTVLALAACAEDSAGPRSGNGDAGGDATVDAGGNAGADGRGGAGDGDGPGRGGEAAGALPLDTVAQGAQGPQRAGEVVARSAEEWSRAWADHQGMPPPPEAGIDFGRQMLVAVFQGQRPSAGFSVQVQEVRKTGDTLEVRYQRSSPGPDCITASVLTAPFHVVAVPRVAGAAQFRAEDRREGC